MSPTRKASASKTGANAREKAAKTTQARCEENARLIARINKSLEVAQSDLSAIGGSIGAGVGDLRKDVAKLLRDARRDTKKMGTAMRRDLEKLQRDLAKAGRDGRAATAGRGRSRSMQSRATTGGSSRRRTG